MNTFSFKRNKITPAIFNFEFKAIWKRIQWKRISYWARYENNFIENTSPSCKYIIYIVSVTEYGIGFRSKQYKNQIQFSWLPFIFKFKDVHNLILCLDLHSLHTKYLLHNLYSVHRPGIERFSNWISTQSQSWLCKKKWWNNRPFCSINRLFEIQCNQYELEISKENITDSDDAGNMISNVCLIYAYFSM